jgi:hypothetical protein
LSLSLSPVGEKQTAALLLLLLLLPPLLLRPRSLCEVVG